MVFRKFGVFPKASYLLGSSDRFYGILQHKYSGLVLFIISSVCQHSSVMVGPLYEYYFKFSFFLFLNLLLLEAVCIPVLLPSI